MAPQEQNEHTCGQCGANVPRDLRYCLECYSPVAGARAARAHVELARETPSTHRPDPTIVFSPERHEAILRRARSRKRVVIASASVVVTIVTGLIALNLIKQHRLAAEKAVARDQAAFRDLSTLGDALERFRIDVGRYPTNAEGLAGLVRRPAEFPPDNLDHSGYWFGPYLEHVPEVDPWGDDYVYETNDGGRSFVLFSHGPGGETGSNSQFQIVSSSHDE